MEPRPIENDHAAAFLRRAGLSTDTYLVTALLHERLMYASLEEVLSYAVGVLAAGDEIDLFRQDRPIRGRRGDEADVESSPAFWRGVLEERGTFFLRSSKAASDRRAYEHPTLRVAGSQLLLSRMYDHFSRFRPSVACPRFLEQIDGEKGRVQLIGIEAWRAVEHLYRGARVGRMLERAEEIVQHGLDRGWKQDEEQEDEA